MKHNLFTEIDAKSIQDNVFQLIDKEWMLVTSGNKEKFNGMTASWGGLGVLWNKPVSFVFVRPTRHTYEFMETSSHYSLSFFGQNCREILKLMGTKSGRDINKMKVEGLTTLFNENEVPFNAEARLVLICEKLYSSDIDKEKVLFPWIHKLYNGNDYHRMYIGEIKQVLSR
ncbi:MAG: flavin reductase [Bacteroidetes bacterium HGW-Bacteroidetes-21]|nr:MAG: flavin reductase [Bacteroidetes bacterium HGW-Bacteroidetes-21]